MISNNFISKLFNNAGKIKIIFVLFLIFNNKKLWFKNIKKEKI